MTHTIKTKNQYLFASNATKTSISNLDVLFLFAVELDGEIGVVLAHVDKVADVELGLNERLATICRLEQRQAVGLLLDKFGHLAQIAGALRASCLCTCDASGNGRQVKRASDVVRVH